MIRCFICFVLGVVVAAIGFQGLAVMLDSGIEIVKDQAQTMTTK